LTEGHNDEVHDDKGRSDSREATTLLLSHLILGTQVPLQATHFLEFVIEGNCELGLSDCRNEVGIDELVDRLRSATEVLGHLFVLLVFNCISKFIILHGACCVIGHTFCKNP